ncbi:MAG: fibrobacter succinogenes major paralogous domain-containing protein [Crocinitomicaceae bacterium]|nr:fibrobacter succinogenes major paralogous domain-containing protein [Crocinitomicaceae bacterium]
MKKAYEIGDLNEVVFAQFYFNGYYSGFDEYLHSFIQMENQYWMGEDLKTTKYKSGEKINQRTWNVSLSENQN